MPWGSSPLKGADSSDLDFATPSLQTSDVSGNMSESQTFDAQCRLPLPFTPPSLSQSAEAKPRSLPNSFRLPDLPIDEACKDIDAQDAGTPDSWVPRDPRLVRLTGKHPFNAEALSKDLFSQGFFTPSSLFFVRNHGSVPRVDSKMAEEWKVQIHGLCENPVSLSINDLRSTFKVATIPATLVCAGNRRKEQNVVKKSLGFSWGATVISTALFTGVWVADVIDFLLSWARDRKRGMMLAWAVNGLPLEPDHGFPLRLVVPGQIGGRSVKWLKRIEFSQNESQHYLHFHDSKVLPTTVGPDQARVEKSWCYIIRDLNVNSVIACPNHNEVLDTESGESRNYTARGYAYSGGGRRITRVEITLDNGKSWRLANIHYVEDQFRELAQFDPIYGHLDLTESDQCFCWCFWSFDIPIAILKNATSIAVRAMDESLALQPRDMYWSATGMMNNWWFRVCIHRVSDGKLRFEHPTMVGTQTDGWMQRLKDQGQDPAAPEFSMSGTNVKPGQPAPPPMTISMTRPNVHRKISMKAFGSHTKPENPWFVMQGEVYEATAYLNEHPGGPQSITLVAGEDETEDFMAIHSSDAKKKLAQYHIGTLTGHNVHKNRNPAMEHDKDHFLHPKSWKPVSLVHVRDVSKDSKLFRFALCRPDQMLGLPTDKHVYIRLKRKVGPKVVGGEIVQRAYTPLSRQEDKGFIDMLVKIYYPNRQYPLGGRMTLGFAELKVGDTVELKGPIGHFVWLGGGMARIRGKELHVRNIGMVCAGSGVTPILQVLRGIFEDTTDESTTVNVLDVNRHLDDILCREELDALAQRHPSRLHIRYSLTGPLIPDGWSHSIGRVNLKMLQDYLPPPMEDGLVCVCGPPLMEQSVKDSSIQLGWNGASQVVNFLRVLNIK
ncbi:hypothetical protein AX16_006031 [Volvariella volvacea WC 439]|nr:hypothetical protein AX16_006031 [Volvariella volvacea WC 439]